MQCPKCDNAMFDISEVEFVAQKCEGCGGIWFQDGSHEVAKSIEGIEKIDSLNTNAAAAYNAKRDIDCPECAQPLFKMTDATQLHIQFEACFDCNGVFFDAGEFADFSEFTFMERVKQTIETLKSNLD